jgi:hypothetical protein
MKSENFVFWIKQQRKLSDWMSANHIQRDGLLFIRPMSLPPTLAMTQKIILEAFSYCYSFAGWRLIAGHDVI